MFILNNHKLIHIQRIDEPKSVKHWKQKLISGEQHRGKSMESESEARGTGKQKRRKKVVWLVVTT